MKADRHACCVIEVTAVALIPKTSCRNSASGAVISLKKLCGEPPQAPVATV